MTLREFVVHWQESWDREHSRPSTYAAHGYLLKNHILPGLGDATLSELTEKHIGEFLDERRSFGGHRPEKPEYPCLGEETMRHIQTLLQQILEQAMQEGLMTVNTARPFYRRRSKTVKAEPLTPLEVEDYLDAAEELGYLPLFLLALTAGLRQRELIALQWSDLDAERCTLTVNEGRSLVNGTLVEYSGDTRSDEAVSSGTQYASEQSVDVREPVNTEAALAQGGAPDAQRYYSESRTHSHSLHRFASHLRSKLSEERHGSQSAVIDAGSRKDNDNPVGLRFVSVTARNEIRSAPHSF